MGTEASRDADLLLALEAVRSAGRTIMTDFRGDLEVHHKGPDQPVTEADLAADRILRLRLTGARPDDGWLSEETADRPERLDQERVWIVDPIDGTRSFIRGYREFAVSVALVEGGEPAVGVIFNPAADHVVWAVVGAGAWGLHEVGVRSTVDILMDGSRLNAGTESGTDTLLASRSERRAGEFAPFEADWTVTEVGSTAWKLAGTAMGRGAYISRGPKSEWDVAAGVLIVDEAGGRATDLRGEPIRFNRTKPYVHGVVAGRPESHRRLLEASRSLDAPRFERDARSGEAGGS